MDTLQYLKDNNAQKQIDKIAKKCKNKKVVFYGAGDLFYKLKNNYDLSAFDVVGICDLKFEKKPEENKTGYKTLTLEQLSVEKYDVIIVTLLNYINVLFQLESLVIKEFGKNIKRDYFQIKNPKSKQKKVPIYVMIVPRFLYLISLLFKK